MKKTIQNNKGNNILLIGAILVYLLITICPFLDSLSNWYVTMLPVGVILFFLLRGRMLQTTLRFLLIALIIATFNFVFFTLRNDFLSYVSRQIVTWTPCLIALLCVNDLSTKSQKLILQVALVAMMITSYTTIIGLKLYPMASRALAGAADEATRSQYMQINLGGFDFIYALVLSIPIIFWMIDHTRGWLKILNIVGLLLFLYCIYMSAYTTALILTIIELLLIAVDKNPKAKPFIITAGIVFVIFAGTGILSSFVMWVSSMVESAYVADRLQQVALLLQGVSAENIDTDTTNDRLLLTQQAINGFFNSPLWGNNITGYTKSAMSGHSYLLDLLSASGILGFSLYVFLFVKLFKMFFAEKFRNNAFQIRIVWLAFIALAFVNPVLFPIIFMVIFTFSVMISKLNDEVLYVK